MKVGSDVHLIDGTMANCYFIENSGDGILIDSGMKGSSKKIIKFLDEGNFNLKTVLITHYHMDHIGGLSRIYEKYKPEIFVPDSEIPVITGKEKMKSSQSMISKFVVSMAKPAPVSSVHPVSDFKSGRIEVIDTHGHTPGSTSYFLKEDGLLFVGDAVVNSKGKLDINRTFTLDIEEAEKSRMKILEVGAKTILSGHGEPYTVKN